MNFPALFKIELLKLFRKSNVIFFFLSIYLFVTPISRGLDEISKEKVVLAGDFYLSIVNSFSIFGMLLLALFIVNSVGNEINEGSFRKALAVGVTKYEYLKGKLILIVVISLFVVFCALLVFFLFGFFSFKIPFDGLLKGVIGLSILKQFLSLFYAGLFGLFLILTFRNRTIGLVFFPFWLITEFFVYLFGYSGEIKTFYEFFPGIAGWLFYTSPIFSIEQFLIVIIYSTIFVTSSWYGLVLREEKSL
ncbi:MAG: ABC transporter permease [Bacteroidales bacterium]|nr:ABC transporter permease [Bacteroidales bacterium]